MSNYSRSHNPEQMGGDREFVASCARRVDIAPVLVERAAGAQFGELGKPDDYTLAARQAQATSSAQSPRGDHGDVVPLNEEAARRRAMLLADPTARTTRFMQEAA